MYVAFTLTPQKMFLLGWSAFKRHSCRLTGTADVLVTFSAKGKEEGYLKLDTERSLLIFEGPRNDFVPYFHMAAGEWLQYTSLPIHEYEDGGLFWLKPWEVQDNYSKFLEDKAPIDQVVYALNQNNKSSSDADFLFFNTKSIYERFGLAELKQALDEGKGVDAKKNNHLLKALIAYDENFNRRKELMS